MMNRKKLPLSQSRKIRISLFSLIFSALSISGCGGGGGGGSGSSAGSARLQLDTSPTTFDVGDRTSLSVSISEMHENGIALKVRFPAALKYVLASAEVILDSSESSGFDIAPINNEADSTENTYLVFYISKSRFGDGEGALILELQGVEPNEGALIEVDADIDDPTISNSVEFDIEAPGFEAQDEKSVRVRG